MQLLLTILGILPFALLGVFVFWIIAGVITMNRSTDNEILKLESEYGTRKIARRDEMEKVLHAIKNDPSIDTSFLWQKYRNLEAEDKRMTNEENQHIVSLQVRISDEEQAELDAGINPYRR